MTNWELIQKLTEFSPDAEILLKAVFKFETDVKVDVDRGEEWVEEEYTTTAEFDDYLEVDEIIEDRNYRGEKEVVVYLEY